MEASYCHHPNPGSTLATLIADQPDILSSGMIQHDIHITKDVLAKNVNLESTKPLDITFSLQEKDSLEEQGK